VRELLRHRRLVAAAHLREARQTGTDDEPLPVRRQLERQLLEEARPDRARADEGHVAAQDVPELRQLVELRPLQPAPDLRVLELGPLHELLPEERAQPRLRVALQRAELDDCEQAAAASDALAPIEDGKAARRGDDRCDHEPDSHGDDAEEEREEDVQDPQLDVDVPLRRRSGERLEARDERLGRPRRRLHGSMLVRLRSP
jgi:hypothetical protein